MKVLHVVRPGHGGVGRAVGGLANHQVGAGLVPVVAVDAGSELVARLHADVRHIPWDAHRDATKGLRTEVLALREIVDRVDPDVVHLHSSKAGLVGRLTLRGRLPTVFQPHGWSWVAVSGLRETAATRWERAALRWTSRVVCVSDGEVDEGRRHGIPGEIVDLVHNGVDPHIFRPRDRTSCRRELGLRDAPTVLMVGRLSEEKGPDLLLDAWTRVAAQVPGAQLVVVGEGPMGPDLERRAGAAGSVRFVGHRRDPEVWYGAADVVALPSRREAMALVPLEAMASGRCVVGFDVDGFRDCLADPTEAAPVAPRGDHAKLAELIVARLTDPAVARREAARHRHRVTTTFDLGHVSTRFDALYAATLAAAPGVRSGLRGVGGTNR